MVAGLYLTRAVEPVATCRQSPYLHKPAVVIVTQGRIKASAGPGALPNAGPLQTYNSV